MTTDLRQPSSHRAEELGYDQNSLEEEENGLEIASAALGQSETTGGVPFYTGNHHHTSLSTRLISIKGEMTGPTSALELCSPGTALPRHLLIPSRARKPIPEEDRKFLLAKGVFALPGNDTCASLLRAYMSHVHPIMPIIEIDQILNHYHDGRLHEYNILLLWCIFFAGVNVSPPLASQICATNASHQFIPASVYQKEGYKSRKEMKSVLYSRANVCKSQDDRSCPIVNTRPVPYPELNKLQY